MDPKSVTVEFLDESLLPGLADLSVGIYGGDRDRLIGYLRQRFLAPYVAGRSVPLLGLDAERTVIASQTWTPFPYRSGERELLALQSGQTMVREDWRRKGLFSRLLRHGEAIARERGVAVFTGFPVADSTPGFVKAGWTDFGTTRWHLRVLRPTLMLRRGGPVSGDPITSAHDLLPQDRPPRVLAGEDALHLDHRHAFSAWRFGGVARGTFRGFRWESGPHAVDFSVRLETNWGVRAAVIGSARGTSDRLDHWVRATRALVSELRRDRSLALVAYLAGPGNTGAGRWLGLSGFLPSRRSAPFMALPVEPGSSLPPSWWIERADIDTWVRVEDHEG
jgi:GNAT superfamily N-acetyltransferase